MRAYLSFHKLFDILKLSFPKYPKHNQARGFYGQYGFDTNFCENPGYLTHNT